MWTMRRDELIAALKHRVAHIRGKLIADQFSIDQYDDPNSRDQVREMIKLGSARIGAEIAWAEALIAKLEKGDYTFETERKKPAAAPAPRARRKRG
jgi:hypothetical protein